MSESVQELLNTFDRLPQAEQLIALTEILKRAGGLEYPPLDDETLDRIAEERFLELDAEEVANGDA